MVTQNTKFIPVSCTSKKCPFYGNCPQIPTELNRMSKRDEVRVLLVGETGGKDKKPFVGKSGILLRNIIAYILKTTIKPSISFAFSSIIRSRPVDFEGNRKSFDEAIQFCIKYLIRDIDKIKPTIICSLGDLPHSVLSSGSELLRDVRGTTLSTTINSNKYNYLCTFHPSWVLRNPGGATYLVNDLRVAFSNKHYKLKKYSNTVISSVKEVKALTEHLKGSKTLAIDIEANNLNRIRDNKILSFQFCGNLEKVSYFVPFGHKDTPFSPKELNEVKRLLVKLFVNKKTKYWLAHNAKFELTIIYNMLGVMIRNPVICTMTYAYILEENYTSFRGYYGLKGISKRLGSPYPKKYIEARGSDLENDLTYDEFVDYGCMDTTNTYQIYKIFNKIAKSIGYYKKSKILLVHLYSRLYKLLARTETKGIAVDLDVLRFLKSPQSPINTRMKKIDKKFTSMPSANRANNNIINEATSSKSLFGNPWVLDLNKVKDKQVLFFDVLNLKPVNIGKNGSGSVDETFQKKYSNVKEVRLFSEYSKLKKLKTSYVESIFDFLDYEKHPDNIDGRVHPSFLATRTVSGRLNSKKPNSQQNPRGDSPVKKAVKDIFCAPPGRVIVEIDNMTSEVRVLGMLSKDEVLLDTFRKAKLYRDKFRIDELEEYKKQANSYDIHNRMAETTGVTRNDSKTLVFGGIYGRGRSSMGRQIGCSAKEAGRKFNIVFGKMRGANEWLTNIENFAEENIYVESPIGRRRRLYDLLLNNEGLSASAKRRARNSPIQGFSSDLHIIAAAHFDEDYIVPNQLDWFVINLVHDASYWEIPITDIKGFIKISELYFTVNLEKIMERNFKYKMPVPMEVEYKIGINSGSTLKWDFTKNGIKEIIKKVKNIDEKRNKRN